MPTTLKMSQLQMSLTTLTDAAVTADRVADSIEASTAALEQTIAENRSEVARYRARAAAHRASADELRALLPAPTEPDPA